MGITHATVASGTDAGTGEIHKAQWNADHVDSNADIIATIWGTPTTAYEFSGSDLGSFTQFGSPDTINENSTVPGALYIKDTNGGFQLAGAYVASPSTPFTAIAKIVFDSARLDFHYGGALFVGAASPGVISLIAQRYNSGRQIATYRASGPTDGGGTSTNSTYGGGDVTATFYLAIIATSNTNVAYYYSREGRNWLRVTSGHNPSTTIGSVGLIVSSGTESTLGCSVAFDYLRLWNSALSITAL